ncbi:low-affinity glucose transporter HXT3 [Kockovaella imperatae]|uniref:Low-affinity glucose transporter HXT3 n=1 Tax=Kockovaella imperatae TaxID=4999 RepID=A0A1Y1UET7_9TREE|nr:low-affinity glucose transporter HXT3 [Kockovaella imperatae]ORX35585.1 low-affinity glucose transporter HXT3 [Kockovaella imperatae]
MKQDKEFGETKHDEQTLRHSHDEDISEFIRPEPKYVHYIPGGYHPSRCLKLSGRPMMYAILLLAGISIMFFGYDASVMSQVNTNKDYLRLMGAAGGSDRDSAAVGGIVSVWYAGFAIGALLVGAYADKVGRLKTIQIGCVWAAIGGALQASAQNITWMMFARVIGGIGCGHLNTVVPIWTSELADPHLRGAFVAVEFTLAILGSTLAYWIEYACTRTRTEAFSWRFPLAFQIVYLVIILTVSSFYPESPRFLAKTGRLDEARDLLTRCRIDPDPIKIEQEMQGIKSTIRAEATGTAHSYFSMLFKRDKFHTRRRIILGGGIQVLQKLTGIDFIAAYSPEMFALSGYSANKSTLLAGGNFFSYTASLALAIYLSDRVGRRKLMLSGSTMMGVVLIIGGVLASLIQKDHAPDKIPQYGAGVAAILYLYTAIYGSTWLTTCWVYPTEVFPLATRAKGTALATVAFSLAGGTINEIIPYLITAVGFWVFIIFALLNFLMCVPIWLFYIETANRDLEDMDLLFSSDSPLASRAEKDFARLRGESTKARRDISA